MKYCGAECVAHLKTDDATVVLVERLENVVRIQSGIGCAMFDDVFDDGSPDAGSGQIGT